jgi:sec-independent protein translocase protein TatA
MGFRGWEWVVIAVVVVGIFGLPKLPSVARSIGKSLRILRDETKGIASDAGDDAAIVDNGGDGKAGDGKAGDGKARGKA